MQKKLIALAIASLVSGTAFAQSNVSIYGAIGISQDFVGTSGATDPDAAGPKGNLRSRGVLSTNSSFLGFKGSEDLGGGLKALWQYETGLTADSGGALAGGRDTYVGLNGAFGTVLAGMLTHPIRVFGNKVDNNIAEDTSGATHAMYGQVIGVKTGSDNRAPNAVAWVSPTVSGIHGVLAYVNGTPTTERALSQEQNGGAAGAAVSAHAWQIAGVYDQGPLFVGLAWDKHTDPGVQATVWAAAANGAAAPAGFASANDSLTITRLAAVYTLPSNTRLSFLWDKQKYETSGSPTATNNTDATRAAYMIGVKQSFGTNSVWLQHAVARDPSGAICNTITCGDFGGKQWTLGVSHDMSKRTVVHAFYSKITNDAKVAYDFYKNGSGITGTNNRGADPASFGVGMRHKF